ncbi:MAG TPA: zinc metalloprotease, partial [Erythrobacter sp.]|nr:zinc metalloprotease [Erythrobacter sp.]
MIRKAIFAGASALAMTLAAPALAEEESAAEASAPTMDFGTWGVGLDMIDNSLEPGDDFDAYVNGRWVAENEIPSDRQRYGAFDMLREKSTHDVETLIAGLVNSNPEAGTQARRIVDAYNAYFNQEAIDASGLAPAQPYLNEIFAAPDLTRLAELFETPGYPALLSAGVTIDARNPTEYAVGVGFDGMGMPDRDYYLVDSESNQKARAAYKVMLTTLLDAAGYADPTTAAEAVYAFEHKVAELEWARQVLRIPTLTYNELTPEQLNEMAGYFPIQALLRAGKFDDQTRFLARQLPPTDEEIEEIGLTEEQLEMIGGGVPAMMKR